MSDWVDVFFRDHLGSRLGCELLPGLRSLTTSFTLAVGDRAPFAVDIEAGMITRSESVSRPSKKAHVRVAEEDFARVVAGQVTPQSLFVRRRLRISGNPLAVLKASSAMEEFFRRFPYHRNQEVSA